MKYDISAFPKGIALLRNSLLNKDTAFTDEEREAFGLEGLIPPRVVTQETQLMRVKENLNRKTSDIEKYIFLTSLQDRNEALFTRLVMENLEELLPIIYTPTVGKACLQYAHIYRRPRGFYFATKYRGKFRKILDNWPYKDVRIIVVTDGERILGLGDLGANGMGIPIGKLSLYTVCGGIHPAYCLPVVIDVGTENDELLKDPLYIGMPHRRWRGEKYYKLVDEFMCAVKDKYPHILVQFEDFGNENAFVLLERYREHMCTFNDDIQGTAAVALGGILSALRITNKPLKDQKFLFMGAGEAGLGIGNLIIEALKQEGLKEEEAKLRCWFFDSKGLIVKGRKGLNPRKSKFAHEHPEVSDFVEAIKKLKPTAIIGVCGQKGAFNEQVLKTMAKINERPIIFALSNPTEKSECTAYEAYFYTKGKAIFASGSPFPPVDCMGKTFHPGQGNNVYIFPGIGLAAVGFMIKKIPDLFFLEAAKILSKQVSEEDLKVGRVYPSLSKIRSVSLEIACRVSEIAYELNLCKLPRPKSIKDHLKSLMYDPRYEIYV
ncbi:oxaloacetate-decarboxylating malate dehydrogenase [Desulfothermus sp.]